MTEDVPVVVSQPVGGDPGFRLRRNLRLFYLLGTVREFTPMLAVWVVYLTDYRNLTLTQVGIMEGLFWGVKLTLEIPSGAFADRFGRKPTFITGIGMEALGTLIFAFSGDFMLLALSYVIWSAGLAFRSGNDQAYLYDALATGGEERTYSDRLGLYRALGTGALLAGGLIGGVLAEVTDLRIAILAALVPFILVTPVMLAMQEPPRHRRPQGELTLAGTLFEGLRNVWHNRALRTIIILDVSLSGAMPAFILLSQPFLGRHGVPLALFGVLAIPVLLAQTAGGLISGRVVRAIGLPATLAVSVAGTVLGLSLLAVIDHVVAFAAFGLTMGSVALAFPAIGAYINDRTGSHVRATVLSIGPMGTSIVLGVASIAAGTIGAKSLQLAFGVTALAVAVIAGGALMAWMAVHSAAERELAAEAVEA